MSPDSAALLNLILRRAETHCARSNWLAACDLLSLAVEAAPDQVQIQSALGSVQYRLEDYPAACASFKAAVNRCPDNPDLHTQLAMAHIQLRQVDEAEAALQRSLKLTPFNPTARQLLGDLRFAAECFADAALQYCAVLESDPNRVGLLLNLGKCLGELRDQATAAWCFERVLALEPTNAIASQALQSLGINHSGAGESDKCRSARADAASNFVISVQVTIRLLIERKDRDEFIDYLERRQYVIEQILRSSSAGRMFHDPYEITHVLQWLWEILQQQFDEEERKGLISEYLQKYPSSRLPYLLKAEQEMEDRLFGAAINTYDRVLALYANDVFPQRRRAHAEELISPDSANADQTAWLSDRFCAKPFTNFEAYHEGHVFVCCQPWLPRTIGNLDEPVENLWNGPAAQELRRSILDGDFSHCSRMRCPAILARSLPKRASITDPQLRQVIDRRLLETPFPPRHINLSYDSSCNLSCPSCRGDVVVASPQQQKRFEPWVAKLRTLVSTASEVLCSGAGDPFASRSYRDLLYSLDHEENPNLLIRLETNGLLFTEANWQKLGKVHRNPIAVQISIDSCTAATYEHVRRGGDFQQLLRNLEFISRLRREGQLKRVSLVFVVQALNYRELPGAVEIADRLGFDGFTLLPLTNWGTYTVEDYMSRDVCNPQHPAHQDFISVLNGPELRKKIVSKNAIPVPHS
jgi:tetratricopeptide (TPR) repeat protein